MPRRSAASCGVGGGQPGALEPSGRTRAIVVAWWRGARSTSADAARADSRPPRRGGNLPQRRLGIPPRGRPTDRGWWPGRACRVRPTAARSRRRSRSLMPPQIPNRSSFSSACRQAVLLDRADRADALGLAGGAALLGEEGLGVGVEAPCLQHPQACLVVEREACPEFGDGAGRPARRLHRHCRSSTSPVSRRVPAGRCATPSQRGNYTAVILRVQRADVKGEHNRLWVRPDAGTTCGGDEVTPCRPLHRGSRAAARARSRGPPAAPRPRRPGRPRGCRSGR